MLQCNAADPTEAQSNGHEGNLTPRLNQQHQQQEHRQKQDAGPPESGIPPKAFELGRAGEESLREGVPIAISPPASPLQKKGMGDNPGAVGNGAGGAGPVSHGPTVAEVLHRLSLFRLDKLEIEPPVNPEKAPRDAIRVAEALAPFPSGIRFDKSTFR